MITQEKSEYSFKRVQGIIFLVWSICIAVIYLLLETKAIEQIVFFIPGILGLTCGIIGLVALIVLSLFVIAWLSKLLYTAVHYTVENKADMLRAIKSTKMRKSSCLILLFLFTISFFQYTVNAGAFTPPVEYSGEDAIVNGTFEQLKIDTASNTAWFGNSGNEWKDTLTALENINSVDKLSALATPIGSVQGIDLKIASNELLTSTVADAITNRVFSMRTVETTYENVETIITAVDENGTVISYTERTEIPVTVPQWWWSNELEANVDALRILELTGGLNATITDAVATRMHERIIDLGGYYWNPNMDEYLNTIQVIRCAEYGYFDLLADLPKITLQTIDDVDEPLYELDKVLLNQTVDMTTNSPVVVNFTLDFSTGEITLPLSLADYTLSAIHGFDSGLLLPGTTLQLTVNTSALPNHENLDYALDTGLAYNMTEIVNENVTSYGVVTTVEKNVSRIEWAEDLLNYEVSIEIIDKTTGTVIEQFSDTLWIETNNNDSSLVRWTMDSIDTGTELVMKGTIKQNLHSITAVIDGEEIMVPREIGEESYSFGGNEDYAVAVDTVNKEMIIGDFTAFNEIIDEFADDPLFDHMPETTGELDEWMSLVINPDYNVTAQEYLEFLDYGWVELLLGNEGELSWWNEEWVKIASFIPVTSTGFTYGETIKIKLGRDKHAVSVLNPDIHVNIPVEASLAVPSMAAVEIERVIDEGDLLFVLDEEQAEQLSPARIITIPAATAENWDGLWEKNIAREGWVFDGLGQLHVPSQGKYYSFIIPDTGMETNTDEMIFQTRTIIENIDHSRPLQIYRDLFNQSQLFETKENDTADFRTDFDYIVYFDQYTGVMAEITSGIPLGAVLDVNNIVQVLQSLKNTTTGLYDEDIGQTVTAWNVLERFGLWQEIVSEEEIDKLYHFVMDEMAVETTELSGEVSYLQTLAFKDITREEPDLETTRKALDFLEARKNYGIITENDGLIDAVIPVEGIIYVRDGNYYTPLQPAVIEGRLLEAKIAEETENKINDPSLLQKEAEEIFYRQMIDYEVINDETPSLKSFDTLLGEDDYYWQTGEKAANPILELLFAMTSLVIAIFALSFRGDTGWMMKLTAFFWSAVFIMQVSVIPLSAMSGQAQSFEYYLNVNKYIKMMEDMVYDISGKIDSIFTRSGKENDMVVTQDTLTQDTSANCDEEQLEDMFIDLESAYDGYTGSFYSSRIEPLPQMTLTTPDTRENPEPATYLEFVNNILAVEGNEYIRRETQQLGDGYSEELEKMAGEKEGILANLFTAYVKYGGRSIDEVGQLQIWRILDEIEHTFATAKNMDNMLRKFDAGGIDNIASRLDIDANKLAKTVSGLVNDDEAKMLKEFLTNTQVSRGDEAANQLKHFKFTSGGVETALVTMDPDSALGKLSYMISHGTGTITDSTSLTVYADELLKFSDPGEVDDIIKHIGKIWKDELTDVGKLAIMPSNRGITIIATTNYGPQVDTAVLAKKMIDNLAGNDEAVRWVTRLLAEKKATQMRFIYTAVGQPVMVVNADELMQGLADIVPLPLTCGRKWDSTARIFASKNYKGSNRLLPGDLSPPGNPAVTVPEYLRNLVTSPSFKKGTVKNYSPPFEPNSARVANLEGTKINQFNQPDFRAIAREKALLGHYSIGHAIENAAVKQAVESIPRKGLLAPSWKDDVLKATLAFNKDQDMIEPFFNALYVDEIIASTGYHLDPTVHVDRMVWRVTDKPILQVVGAHGEPLTLRIPNGVAVNTPNGDIVFVGKRIVNGVTERALVVVEAKRIRPLIMSKFGEIYPVNTTASFAEYTKDFLRNIFRMEGTDAWDVIPRSITKDGTNPLNMAVSKDNYWSAIQIALKNDPDLGKNVKTFLAFYAEKQAAGKFGLENITGLQINVLNLSETLGVGKTFGSEFNIAGAKIGKAMAAFMKDTRWEESSFAGQMLAKWFFSLDWLRQSPLTLSPQVTLFWDSVFGEFFGEFSDQDKLAYLEADVYSGKGYEQVELGGRGFIAGEIGDASFTMIAPPGQGADNLPMAATNNLAAINSLMEWEGDFDYTDDLLHFLINGNYKMQYAAQNSSGELMTEDDSKGYYVSPSSYGLPGAAYPIWGLQNWSRDTSSDHLGNQVAAVTEAGFNQLFGSAVNLVEYPNVNWIWRSLPEKHDLTADSQALVRLFDNSNWNSLNWNQGEIVFRVRNSANGEVKNIGIMVTPNKTLARDTLWANDSVDGKFYLDPVTWIDNKYLYNESAGAMVQTSMWESKYVPETVNLYEMARDVFNGVSIGDLEVISFSLGSGTMAGTYKQTLLFGDLRFDNGVAGINAYQQAVVKIFNDHASAVDENMNGKEFWEIKSGDMTYEEYFVLEAKKLATGAVDGNAAMTGENNARDWFVAAKRSDTNDEFRQFSAIGAVMVWDYGSNGIYDGGTGDDDLKGIICEQYDFIDAETLNGPAWTTLPGEEVKTPVAIYHDVFYDNGWDDPDLWLGAAIEIMNGMKEAGHPAMLVTAEELVEFMASTRTGIVVLLGALPETIWGCYDDTKTASATMASNNSLLELFMQSGGTVLTAGQHGGLTQIGFPADDTHDDPWLGDYYVSGNNPGGISGVTGLHLISPDDVADADYQNSNDIGEMLVASGAGPYPSSVTDYYSSGIPSYDILHGNIIYTIDELLYTATSSYRGDFIIRVEEPVKDGDNHQDAGIFINYHTAWDDNKKGAVNWGNAGDFTADIVALLTGIPDTSETTVYPGLNWLHEDEDQFFDNNYIYDPFFGDVSGWTGLSFDSKSSESLAKMTANSAVYSSVSLAGKNAVSYPYIGADFYLPGGATALADYSETSSWASGFDTQGEGSAYDNVEGDYSFYMKTNHSASYDADRHASNNSGYSIAIDPYSLMHFAVNPWDIQAANWGSTVPYWIGSITSDPVGDLLTVNNASMPFDDYNENQLIGKVIEDSDGTVATITAVVSGTQVRISEPNGGDDGVFTFFPTTLSIKDIPGRERSRYPNEWYLELGVDSDGNGTADKYIRYYFSMNAVQYYYPADYTTGNVEWAGTTKDNRYFNGTDWLPRENYSNWDENPGVDSDIRWVEINAGQGEWSTVDRNILGDYNSLFGSSRTAVTVKEINFSYTSTTYNSSVGDTILLDDLVFIENVTGDYYFTNTMTDGKNKFVVYNGLSADGTLTIDGRERTNGESWQTDTGFYMQTPSDATGSWLMQEGEGSTVEDGIGSNDGTIYNATWDGNGYLDFDGDGDYILNSTHDGIGDDMLTFATWIYNRGSHGGGFGGLAYHLNGYSNNYTNRIGIYDDGKILAQLYLGATRSLISTSTVPVDEWSHVAFTWKKSTGVYNFYINGQPAGNGTTTTSYYLSSGSTALNLGRAYTSTYYLNGKMQGTHLWSRELSATEVSDLHSSEWRSSNWCVVETNVLPTDTERVTDTPTEYSWYGLNCSPVDALAAIPDAIIIDYSQLVYTDDLTINGVANNTWIDNIYVETAENVLSGEGEGKYLGTTGDLAARINSSTETRSLDTFYIRDYDTLEFDFMVQELDTLPQLDVLLYKDTIPYYGASLLEYSGNSGYNDISDRIITTTGRWNHVVIDLKEDILNYSTGEPLGRDAQLNTLRFDVATGSGITCWVDNLIIHGDKGILMTQTFDNYARRGGGYDSYQWGYGIVEWPGSNMTLTTPQANTPGALAMSDGIVDLANETLLTMVYEGPEGTSAQLKASTYKEDGSFVETTFLCGVGGTGWGKPETVTADLTANLNIRENGNEDEERYLAFFEIDGYGGDFIIHYIRTSSGLGQLDNFTTLGTSDYLLEGTSNNNGTVLSESFDREPGTSTVPYGWDSEGNVTLTADTTKSSSGDASLKYVGGTGAITGEIWTDAFSDGSIDSSWTTGYIDQQGSTWSCTETSGQLRMECTNKGTGLSQYGAWQDGSDHALPYTGDFDVKVTAGLIQGYGNMQEVHLELLDSGGQLIAALFIYDAWAGTAKRIYVRGYENDGTVHGTYYGYFWSYNYTSAFRVTRTDGTLNLYYDNSNPYQDSWGDPVAAATCTNTEAVTSIRLRSTQRNTYWGAGCYAHFDDFTMDNTVTGDDPIAYKYFDSVGGRSVVSYSVNFADSDMAKIHVTDSLNNLYSYIYNLNGELRFYSLAHGAETLLSSITLDRWYKVRLEINSVEEEISVYIDGDFKGTFAIDSFDTSCIAIEGADTTVYLDDLQVIKDDVTVFNGTVESLGEGEWYITEPSGATVLSTHDTGYDIDDLELYLPMDGVYYDPVNPEYSVNEQEMIYDLSPNGNNVTVNGDAHFDELEGAWKFDGSDDFIDLSDIDEDWSNGFTFSTWVKYDSFQNYSRLIDFGNGPNNNNILIYNSSTTDDLRVNVINGSTSHDLIASGALETGNWMYLTVTIDGTANTTIYKNGIEIASGTTAVPNNVNRVNNYIGKSNWSTDGYFDGHIRDVNIWSFAKTAEQIWTDYAGETLFLDSYPLYSREYPAGDARSWEVNATIDSIEFDGAGYLLEGTGVGAGSDLGVYLTPSTIEGKATVGYTNYYGTQNSREVYLPGYGPQVLCLPMNEGEGTEINDSSPYGNNGTLEGDVSWTSEGLYFDGTDDYIIIDDTIEPDYWTISAWIRQSSVTAHGKIIGKDYRGDGTWSTPWSSYALNSSDGTSGKPKIEVAVGGTHYTVIATTVLQNDVWYYLVGTYDGSNLKIYVNGKLENTNSSMSGVTDYASCTNHALTIANRSPYNPGERFNGKIKGIEIHARVLTGNEIHSLAGNFCSVAPEMIGPWEITVTQNRGHNDQTSRFNLSASSLYGSDNGLETEYAYISDGSYTSDPRFKLLTINGGGGKLVISDIAIEAIDPMIYTNQGNGFEGSTLEMYTASLDEYSFTTEENTIIMTGKFTGTAGDYMKMTINLEEEISPNYQEFLYVDVFVESEADDITKLIIAEVSSPAIETFYFNSSTSSPSYPSGEWHTLAIPLNDLIVDSYLNNIYFQFRANSGATDLPVSLHIGRLWIARQDDDTVTLSGENDGVLTDGLTTYTPTAASSLAAFTSRDGSLTLLHRDTATDSYLAKIGIDTAGWTNSDDMAISFDWRLDFFDNNSSSDEILAGINLGNASVALSIDSSNVYPVDDADDDEKPDTLGEWVHFEASIEELFPYMGTFNLDPYLYIAGNGQGRIFQFKVRNLRIYEEPSAMGKIISLKTTDKKTANFNVDRVLASPMYPLYSINGQYQNTWLHNLIPNPGFDEQPLRTSSSVENTPAKWDITGEVILDATVVHSGNYSARMSSAPSAAILSSIICTGNDPTYDISGEVKVSFYYKGDFTGSFSWDLLADDLSVAGQSSLSGSEEWTLVEYYVNVSDVENLELKFIHNSSSPIYIDSVSLEFTGLHSADDASTSYTKFRSGDPWRIASSEADASFASYDGWYLTSFYEGGYIDPSADTETVFGEHYQYYLFNFWVDQEEHSSGDWSLFFNGFIFFDCMVALWLNGDYKGAKNLNTTSAGYGDLVFKRGLNTVLIKHVVFSDGTNDDLFSLSISRLSWTGKSFTPMVPNQQMIRTPAVYYDPQYQSEWISRSSDPEHNNLEITDSRYELIIANELWSDAKVDCEKRGGHLVTITSSEENDFVNQLAGSNRVWIGMYEIENYPLEWGWITGEDVSYTNWDTDEPDDYPFEDYGRMMSNGMWESMEPYPLLVDGYICEWDSRPYTKTNKLVLDLPLNEGEGMIAMDHSFNSISGNLSGTSWDGNGLLFDGSANDIVDCGSLADNIISKPEGDISFAFWYNSTYTGLNYQYVISSGAETASTGVYVNLHGGNMAVGVKTSNKAVDTGEIIPYSANEWAHVAVVYDESANIMYIYINGELFDDYTGYTGSWSNVYTDLVLGQASCNKTAYDYKGHLKSVKFWNYALSEDEIGQVMTDNHRDPVEDNVALLADGITANLLAGGLPGMVVNSQRLKYYMDTEVQMYNGSDTGPQTVWHPFGQVLMTTDVLPELVYDGGTHSFAEQYLEAGGKIVWSTGYMPFSIKAAKAEALVDSNFITGDNGAANYGYPGAVGHQRVFDIDGDNNPLADRNGVTTGPGTPDYEYGMFIYDSSDPGKFMNNTQVDREQTGTIAAVTEEENYTLITTTGVVSDYLVGKPVFNVDKLTSGYVIGIAVDDYVVSKDMEWAVGDEFIIGSYMKDNDKPYIETAGHTKQYFDYEPYLTPVAAYSQLAWTGLKAHAVMGKHEYVTSLEAIYLNRFAVSDITGNYADFEDPSGTDQDEFRNDQAIDPVESGLWFQPVLLDNVATYDNDPVVTEDGINGEWFYCDDASEEKIWYYKHERYNLGSGAVQAGKKAKGIVSFLPFFDWNEPAPGYGSYSSMPLTGISYKRELTGADYNGRYSDRTTGGIINTPSSRASALKDTAMAIGAMVIASLMSNLDINACADNDTTSTNLLPVSVEDDVYTTNTSGPELYLSGTTDDITGVDYTRYPLFEGSYQKLLFDNGIYDRYKRVLLPLSSGSPQIQDLVGNSDTLGTWIGTDHDSSEGQYLSIEGMEYSGDITSYDTVRPDLNTAFIIQKDNGLSNSDYSMQYKNAIESNEYAVGVSVYTSVTAATPAPWDVFPGDGDGQNAQSTPVEYSYTSPWGETFWGSGYGLGHEMPLRQSFINANNQAEYENHEWDLRYYNPSAPPADFTTFYRDFQDELDWTGWLRRGYYQYPVDKGGTAGTQWNWGASMPWSKLNPTALSLVEHDGTSGEPLWSTGWTANLDGTDLTFTVTNNRGDPNWEKTFTFSEYGAVDEYGEWSEFSGEWDRNKDEGEDWGTAKFSPYGTAYESAPMGDDGSAVLSGHQTVGAIAIAAGSPVDFWNPNAYAARTTQWLVSAKTGVTYTDNSGITLRNTESKDISALIITPAMNCYYRPINEEDVQQLLVNSPTAIWVELYQGDPASNQPVFRQKYAMANYQTSDLVITMDEAVEDVLYIRTWVDNVYDSTYRDGSTSGSGTAATSNMGGFAQIRIIEEADADLVTLTASDCEESIRYSAAADMSLLDSGDYNWASEPITAGTMLVNYGVSQSTSPNTSKRYNVHQVTTVSHTSAVASSDDIENWRELKPAKNSDADFAVIILASLMVLAMAGCIILGTVLSFGGLPAWIGAIGWTLQFFGYLQLAVNAPMFTAMAHNVVVFTTGGNNYLDAFEQFNVELQMRDYLIQNYGLAGFLVFYFAYDLDFTLSRLVLTTIRPDLSPFLWDETEAQYWGEIPMAGTIWWADDDSRWDLLESLGWWDYWL